MNVVEDVRAAAPLFPHVVLTVGSFDGVHCGHRRVLEEVCRLAREARGTAAVLTMRPHPREFFSPQHAPNLLTADAAKLRLLDAAGIDVVFLLEFTADVANLECTEFVEEIVCGRCQANTVVVGHDFRFGKGARGDYEFLQAAGARLGFDVYQVPPLIIEGERVSSSLIRERVLQGDLEKAETFLGRKYSLAGGVVSGRGIGVQLGFPTANIRPYHSAIPAQGVYAAMAHISPLSSPQTPYPIPHIPQWSRPAAVNIGVAPTIRQEDIVIEAFLLDFHENIVGAEIELEFHQRLRSEKKFGSREELAAQIRQDVERVRQYFAQHAEAVPA